MSDTRGYEMAMGEAGDRIEMLHVEIDRRDTRIRELEARQAAAGAALMVHSDLCAERDKWQEKYLAAEARLAACVGALGGLLEYADPVSEGELYSYLQAKKILSSPDLAPWRDLVGAVRAVSRFLGLEEGKINLLTVSAVLAAMLEAQKDAARRCGLEG